MLSKQYFLIRVFSVLVCCAFLSQELVLANPDTLTSLFATPANVSQDVHLHDTILNPAKLNIPFEHSTLKEVHSGDNGKLVICLQDPHSNYSGQMSIAASLDQLMSSTGQYLVLAEGAATEATLTEIKGDISKSDWKIAAQRFLRDGVISGVEYLNLTSNHPMKIMGIEESSLYNRSLTIYGELVKKRKKILVYLHRIKTSMERLKAKLYPESLIVYERITRDASGAVSDVNLQHEELIKLIDLASVDLTNYPEVIKLSDLKQIEKGISFEHANQDQEKLLAELTAKGFKDSVQKYREAAKKTQKQQVSQGALLGRLFDLASSQGIDIRIYSELNRYLDYLRLFNDLDIEAAMRQTDSLEDIVYKSLLQSEDARKLRAVDRFVGLLGKAYRIKMSSSDFKKLVANKNDFKTVVWQAFLNEQLIKLEYFDDLVLLKSYLEDAAEPLFSFYQLVDERDRAFLKNTNRIMSADESTISYLIAGGYHTEHLVQLLKAEGYSIAVLTPRVENETDHSLYEKMLLTPLTLPVKEKSQEGSGRTQTVGAPSTKSTLVAALSGGGLSSSEAIESRLGNSLSDKRLRLPARQLVHAAARAEQVLEAGTRMSSPDERISIAFMEAKSFLSDAEKADSRSLARVRRLFDDAERDLGRSSSRIFLGRAMLDFVAAVSSTDAGNYDDALRAKKAFETQAHRISELGSEIVEIMTRMLREIPIDVVATPAPASPEDRLSTALQNAVELLSNLASISAESISDLRREVLDAKRLLGRDSARALLALAMLDFLSSFQAGDRVSALQAISLFSTTADRIGEAGGQILAVMQRILNEIPIDIEDAPAGLSPEERLGAALKDAVELLRNLTAIRTDSISDLRREVRDAKILLGRDSARALLTGAVLDFLSAFQSGDRTSALQAISLFSTAADRIGAAGGQILESMKRMLNEIPIDVADAPAGLSPGERLGTALQNSVELLRNFTSINAESISDLRREVRDAKRLLNRGSARALLTEAILDFLSAILSADRDSRSRAISVFSNSADRIGEVGEQILMLMREIELTLERDRPKPTNRSPNKAQLLIDNVAGKIRNNERAKVCYICTANMNRSAIAHILTEDERTKKGRTNLEVVSGGLYTNQLRNYDNTPLQGAPVQPDYEPGLQKVGVAGSAIQKFTSQQITRDKLSADLIVVASTSHKEDLISKFSDMPGLADRIVLFTEIHPSLAEFGDEMPDPQKGDVSKDKLIQLIKGSVITRLFRSRMTNRILNAMALDQLGDDTSRIIVVGDTELALSARAGLENSYSNLRLLVQFLMSQSEGLRTNNDELIRVATPSEINRFAGPNTFNAFDPRIAKSAAQRLIRSGQNLEINVEEKLFMDTFNREIHKLFADTAKRGGHDVDINGGFDISHPEYRQMYLITPEALQSGQYTNLIRQGATVISVNAVGLDEMYTQTFLVDLLGFTLSGLDGKASSAQRFTEITAQIQSALGVKITIKVALTLSSFEGSPQAIEVVVEHTIPANASKADIQAQALSLAQVVWAA